MPLKNYAFGSGIAYIASGVILITASIVTIFLSWFKYVQVGFFIAIGLFVVSWAIVGSVLLWSEKGPLCSSVNYSCMQ